MMMSVFVAATIVLLASSSLGLDYTYKAAETVSSDWECERETASLFYDMPPRSLDELTSLAVPNNVFYVWCDDKTFEFKHFLSVKSVWKYLEPETIVFYYHKVPKQSDYHDWLEILNTTIPNFRMMPMTRACDECRSTVLQRLYTHGGLYVSEDTILLSALARHRNGDITFFLDDNNQSYIKTMVSQPQNNLVLSAGCITNFQHNKDNSYVQTETCHRVDDLHSNVSISTGCVYLNTKVFPRNIFSSSDDIVVKLREIAYGVTETLVPRRDERKIPKVIHYIWYNKVDMTFFMYLSMLSSLYIVQPDIIFVHGGQDIHGPYWDKVKDHPKVKVIVREKNHWIFGNQVLLTQHFSDVMRLDILYKYGGMYIDWDVLWLKPVDDLLASRFDVIINVNHAEHHPFPDTINTGVILTKPRARYLDIWRQTYQYYRAEDFAYNSLKVSYKVYERYPTLLKLEPRLQVMCYYLKCHPVFHPDYKIQAESQPFNWKTDVYSIHITDPDPEAFKDETALKEVEGMFADMGRYIMEMAEK